MLKWIPKSEHDLDCIREHIAEKFNVDLAIQTVDALVDYAERVLSSNPLAGRVLEPNPLFSKLIYDGNSIYYCENPQDRNLYVVYVRARGMKLQSARLNDAEVA